MNAILSFKSHTAGKNADVTVYSDRIEWVQKKSLSAGWWAATILTCGMWAVTLLIPRRSSTEMVPTKSITSVLSSRKTFFTEITVVASGNTVSFNVTNDQAETIKRTLTGLVLAA
jgi:hypothetical protein